MGYPTQIPGDAEHCGTARAWPRATPRMQSMSKYYEAAHVAVTHVVNVPRAYLLMTVFLWGKGREADLVK